MAEKVNTFRQESTNLGKSQYFKIDVNTFSTKTLSTSQPKLGKVRGFGKVIRSAVNKISTTSVNQFRMDVNKFSTTVNSFRKV